MLKKISLQALQFAIQKAIGLDPEVGRQLLGLEHKKIEIVVLPLHVHFYMLIENGTIYLKSEIHQTPDTIIHSSPLGLIRLSLLPASKTRSLFNDNIQISGDVGLGQEIKKIFDSIHIDWEGHLAYFTGDVVAHHVGKLFRKGRDTGKQYAHHLIKHGQDYLIHDLKGGPSKQELEQFYTDVDDLRLRTERLSAHFHYLLTQYETP
jgi:ubiquinone biosynthesis protein UbiJ